MDENTVRFTRDEPISLEHYGKHSPLLVMNDLVFEFKIPNDEMEQLCIFFNSGYIPSIIPMSWTDLDKYLDIPILSKLFNESWIFGGDQYLWLLKLKSRHADGCFESPKWINKLWKRWAANYASENGHLETLKWIRKNGGEWSTLAADKAALNGHLETLKWIRKNGGEWSTLAADNAARNGHLETLKWVRENGGEWTHRAANNAASNGHLETLKWIRKNGGEWTHLAADWAATHGHFETLKWIRENGAD
jgi:hypothetical protein